jgi:2'-5' RNA ligase
MATSPVQFDETTAVPIGGGQQWDESTAVPLPKAAAQPAKPAPAPDGQLPTGTLSAAPEPSLIDRARDSVGNSIVGKALGMESTLVPGSPEYRQTREAMPQLPGWASQPVWPKVRQSMDWVNNVADPRSYSEEGRASRQKEWEQKGADQARFNVEHPIAANISQKVNEFGESMTSPTSMGLMATGPLGNLGKVSDILTGVFAAQSAKGSYDSIEKARKDYSEGNNPEAQKSYREIVNMFGDPDRPISDADFQKAWDTHRDQQKGKVAGDITEAVLDAAMAGLMAHSVVKGMPIDRGRPSVTEPKTSGGEFEQPQLGAGARPPVEFPPDTPVFPLQPAGAPRLQASTPGEAPPNPQNSPGPVNPSTAIERTTPPTQFAPRPEIPSDKGVIVDEQGNALPVRPGLPAPRDTANRAKPIIPKIVPPPAPVPPAPPQLGSAAVMATPTNIEPAPESPQAAPAPIRATTPAGPVQQPQAPGTAEARPVVQTSGEPTELRESAQDQKPVLDQMAGQVAAAVPGAEVVGPRVKSAESIENKDERGKAPETNIDNLGVRVVAPSPAAVPAVQKAVESQLPVVSKDNIENNNLNVQQYGVRTGAPGEPNQVSELQVIPSPAVAAAMKETDPLYAKQKEAIARGDKTEADRLGAQIEKKFKEAQEQRLYPSVKKAVQAQGVNPDDTEAWGTAYAAELQKQAAAENAKAAQPQKPATPQVPALPGMTPMGAQPVGLAHPLRKGEPVILPDGRKATALHHNPNYSQGGRVTVQPEGSKTPETFKGDQLKRAPVAEAQPTPVQQGQPAPGAPRSIGQPIRARIKQIKELVAKGQKVVIFSAEADNPAIHDALTQVGLGNLPVTNIKGPDFGALLDNEVNVKSNANEPMEIPSVPAGKALYVDFDGTLFTQPETSNQVEKHEVTFDPDQVRSANEQRNSAEQPAGATANGRPEEAQGAIQKPAAAQVDERQPGKAGEAGSERGRVEPEQQGTQPAGEGAKPSGEADRKEEVEPKFKHGNTQADIPPDSDAGKALAKLRKAIDPADLMGDGLIDDAHITVRYGIDGDTAGIRAYLEKQAPFEASLGKTQAFPPSEHSDGAAPIIVPVESADLRRMEKEIEKHGTFAERSFPEYKPHATVAYVKPEEAKRYTGMTEADGKTFTVKSISITDRDGNSEEVKLKGTAKPAFSAAARAKVQPKKAEEVPASQTAIEQHRAAHVPGTFARLVTDHGHAADALVKLMRDPKADPKELAAAAAKVDELAPEVEKESPGGGPTYAEDYGYKKPTAIMDRPARTDAIGKPGVEVPAKYEPKPNESSTVATAPKKPESLTERFKRAQQAKADKYLDTHVRRADNSIATRRAIIDERMAGGGTTSVKQIQDDAAERKLDREIGAMRRAGVPTGNEMHPTTIKYRGLLAQQKAGIKVPSYRITDKDGETHIVPKTEYDYAKSIEEKPAAPVKTEAQAVAPGTDGPSVHEQNKAELEQLQKGLKRVEDALAAVWGEGTRADQSRKIKGIDRAKETPLVKEKEALKQQIAAVEYKISRHEDEVKATARREALPLTKPEEKLVTDPDVNKWKYQAEYFVKALEPAKDAWLAKYGPESKFGDKGWDWESLVKAKQFETPQDGVAPEKFPDDYIRIEVPGDGKFLVKNSPAAIDKLLKSAPRAFAKPTSTGFEGSKRSVPRAPKELENEKLIAHHRAQIDELEKDLRRADDAQRPYYQEQLQAAQENLADAEQAAQERGTALTSLSERERNEAAKLPIETNAALARAYNALEDSRSPYLTLNAHAHAILRNELKLGYGDWDGIALGPARAVELSQDIRALVHDSDSLTVRRSLNTLADQIRDAAKEGAVVLFAGDPDYLTANEEHFHKWQIDSGVHDSEIIRRAVLDTPAATRTIEALRRAGYPKQEASDVAEMTAKAATGQLAKMPGVTHADRLEIFRAYTDAVARNFGLDVLNDMPRPSELAKDVFKETREKYEKQNGRDGSEDRKEVGRPNGRDSNNSGGRSGPDRGGLQATSARAELAKFSKPGEVARRKYADTQSRLGPERDGDILDTGARSDSGGSQKDDGDDRPTKEEKLSQRQKPEPGTEAGTRDRSDLGSTFYSNPLADPAAYRRFILDPIKDMAAPLTDALQRYAGEARTAEDVQKGLVHTERAQRARQVRVIQTIERLLKKEGFTPEDGKQVFRHIEDTGVKLTPKQTELRDKWINPLNEAARKQYTILKLIQSGRFPIDDILEGKVSSADIAKYAPMVDGYMHRIAAGHNAQLDRIMAGVSKGFGGKRGTLSRALSSAKHAVFQEAHSPSGQREVVAIKGGRVRQFINSSNIDVLDSKIAALERGLAEAKAQSNPDRDLIDRQQSQVWDLKAKRAQVEADGLATIDLGAHRSRYVTTDQLANEAVKPLERKLDSIEREERTLRATQSRMAASAGRLRNIAVQKADLERQIAAVRASVSPEYAAASGLSQDEILAERLRPVQAQIDRLTKEQAKLNAISGRTSAQDRRLGRIAKQLRDLDAQKGDIEDEQASEGLQGRYWRDKFGGLWKFDRGTTEFITSRTGQQYYDNAILSSTVNYLETARAAQAAAVIESQKAMLEENGLLTRETDPSKIPDGWKGTQLMQMRGMSFPPHIADAYDQFAEKMGRGSPDLLDKINRFNNQMVLMNPLMHGKNVVSNWITGKLSEGIASGRILNPVRYVANAKAGIRALNAVWSLNEDYLHPLENGLDLLRTNPNFDSGQEEIVRSLAAHLALDKETAAIWKRVLGIPGNILEAMRHVNHTATFGINDLFTLQAYYSALDRFTRDGIPDPETAARDWAHRQVIEYRPPVRFMGSRAAEKVLENPKLFAFWAYHSDLLRQVAQAVSDAAGTGFKEEEETPGRNEFGQGPLANRANGLAKLAVMAAIATALYPLLLDPLAKKLTGDDRAKAPRGGLPGLASNVYESAKGERDWSSTASGVFTPALGTENLMETIANRDFFTGRHIRGTGQEWKTQVEQLGSWIGKRSLAGQLAGRMDQGQGRQAMYALLGFTFQMEHGIKEAAEIRRDKAGSNPPDPQKSKVFQSILAAAEQARRSEGNDTRLADALEDSGKLSKGQINEMEEAVLWPPIVFAVNGMNPQEVYRVFEKSTEQEKRDLLNSEPTGDPVGRAGKGVEKNHAAYQLSRYVDQLEKKGKQNESARVESEMTPYGYEYVEPAHRPVVDDEEEPQ